MAGTSWKTFEEVVVAVDRDGIDPQVDALELVLDVHGSLPCPAPWWDKRGIYRVLLVGGVPTIQKRTEGGQWVAAPLTAPAPSDDATSASLPARSTETRTLNILFMDLAGWSKLGAVQVTAYIEKVLPKLAEIVKGRSAMHHNTWGDALVATFTTAVAAANCALDIRDLFRRTAEGDGVPRGLTPRLSLHVGDVIVAWNPLIQRQDIFGHAVHVAARLEPVTERGQVYCTEQFAAGLTATDGLGPAAHHLGNVTLPKDFGTLRVFAVVGPNENPPPALPTAASSAS